MGGRLGHRREPRWTDVRCLTHHAFYCTQSPRVRLEGSLRTGARGTGIHSPKVCGCMNDASQITKVSVRGCLISCPVRRSRPAVVRTPAPIYVRGHPVVVRTPAPSTTQLLRSEDLSDYLLRHLYAE